MIKNLIVFHGSNLNINNQIKEFENILPLFLLPGNHLSYEIPNIVKEFNKTFPDIAVNINNYLASDNIFIKYIANKLK